MNYPLVDDDDRTLLEILLGPGYGGEPSAEEQVSASNMGGSAGTPAAYPARRGPTYQEVYALTERVLRRYPDAYRAMFPHHQGEIPPVEPLVQDSIPASSTLAERLPRRPVQRKNKKLPNEPRSTAESTEV